MLSNPPHSSTASRLSNLRTVTPADVADRNAFIALLPADAEVLEIGPFYTPLLRGENIHYFDVLDRAGLVARAERLELPTADVPREIHYVSPTGDLSIVDRTFDAVISSHVIEHQPDLIAHLDRVGRLLRPGGMYLILVPDRRYCLDHFIRPSTIADVLEAYYTGRTVHSLKSQIEHIALTTHNKSRQHWLGDHGEPNLDLDAIRQTIAAYRAKPENYVDVHAWTFEPETFAELMRLLVDLDHSALELVRVFPSRKKRNEFWAVLAKRDGQAAVSERDRSTTVVSWPTSERAESTPEEPSLDPVPSGGGLEGVRQRLGELRDDPRGFLSESRSRLARGLSRFRPLR